MRWRYQGRPGRPSASSKARSTISSCRFNGSNPDTSDLRNAVSRRSLNRAAAARIAAAASRTFARASGLSAPGRRFHRRSTSFANSSMRRHTARSRAARRRRPASRSATQAPELHERDVITESWIADARDPVVVVVHRVVDAVGSVERQVRDGHAEEVQEHRVVGSAAEAIVDQARGRRRRQRACGDRDAVAASGSRETGSLHRCGATSSMTRLSAGTAGHRKAGPDAALSTLR